MGQDVILEYEDYFEVKQRLKAVSNHSRSNRSLREQGIKQQPTSRNHHFKLLDPDLRELSRSYSSSICYESMSSKTFDGVSGQEVLKRGSMYQSSEEVRRMRKLREGRRKVDSACRKDEFLSFEIVDSLPQSCSNQDVLLSHQGRSSLVSSNSVAKSTSVVASHSITTRSSEFLDLSFRDLPEKNLNPKNLTSDFDLSRDSSVDDFVEIRLDTAKSETHHTQVPSRLLDRSYFTEQRLDCTQKISSKCLNEHSCEADKLKALPKSFSAKVGVSNAASQLECELVNASPKTRSTPFQKLFDPIMKSKSLRNISTTEIEPENPGNAPSNIKKNKVSTMEIEPGNPGNAPSNIKKNKVPTMEIEPGNPGNAPSNIRKNKVLNKSLLSDFLKTTEMEPDVDLRGDEKILAAASSPAHLHAFLKVEIEDGNTSFEFSVKDPDDVLSAKTWRTDNAYNWVYTFHNSRKKSSSRKGAKDKSGQSPTMVGQMQVSCYLCSEVRENGSLANSTVTEFVLYDIVQARRNFVIEERSQCSSDSVQSLRSDAMDSLVPLDRNNTVEPKSPARHTSSNCDSDASTSYPWSPTDLHPQLEIAATVIQIPFNKKDKFKDIKDIEMKESRNVASSCAVDPKNETDCKNQNPAVVKVVTPSGKHGLSNTDEDGRPSTLLDRWRFGGGCDCGGWDMGCPIIVFDNHYSDDWVNCLALKSQKPMLLYAQGNKDNVPALTIMADGQGQYSVNFHAQLSALQAFSICIAILHSSEASSTLIHEKSRQRFFSSSLRLLLEEEVRQLLEAVAIEEKRKEKRVEQIPPTFVLDPPFSPMSRV